MPFTSLIAVPEGIMFLSCPWPESESIKVHYSECMSKNTFLFATRSQRRTFFKIGDWLVMATLLVSTHDKMNDIFTFLYCKRNL